MSRFRSSYSAGQWVEVRSKEEILVTLDQSGSLDKLPFMPEMLRHCGRRFQVLASAHKTCDTVNQTGGRRMRNAVHLEGLRCDGSAHGDCQAGCLMFWKEAWLKPADAGPLKLTGAVGGCNETTLMSRVRETGDDPKDPTYVCQATRLYDATTLLKRWSPRQYVADVVSGNVPLDEALRVLFLSLVYRLREFQYAFRLTRWLYDRAHLALRGTPSPYGNGAIPGGGRTPNKTLDLQVGEVVRVKSKEEILATVDERNRNRGLSFDKEMVRYCGKELRVGARVKQIVNESTGRLMRLPNPAIILEGAYCQAQYSDRRLLCPRRILPYWREIWLERTVLPTQRGQPG